jgi:hypothetical protein
MATIWGISEGEYDEHHVLAIFSTEDKAQAYLAEYNRIRFNHAYLEEVKLDPEPPQSVAVIEVCISNSGDVIKAIGPFFSDAKIVGFSGYGPAVYRGPSAMWWDVETDNKEHAIEVANEKRAMLIAAGVWGDYRATRALLDKEA